MSSGIGNDRVTRLLRDHVDSAEDEQPRDAREYRGVDDPQALGLSHVEPAVEHRVLVATADPAGTASVMSPGVALHEACDLLGGLDLRSGYLLGQPGGEFIRHDRADVFHALDQPFQIIARYIIAL